MVFGTLPGPVEHQLAPELDGNKLTKERTADFLGRRRKAVLDADGFLVLVCRA